MDNINRKRLLDLIKTDLTTMSGGERGNSTVFALGLMAFIFMLGGFIISPMAGGLVPMIAGFLVADTVTSGERRSGCEKMYGVLPIERRELVRSRFVFVMAVTAGISLINFLLMLLSLKLRLYEKIADSADILGMMSAATDSVLSETGALGMGYAGFTALGLCSAAAALRDYFKRSGSLGEIDDPLDSTLGTKKKLSVRDRVIVILSLAIAGCFFLGMTGMINFLAPLSLIMGLLTKLSQVANGILLAAVFLTTGILGSLYQYVCAVIDYEERDM